MNADTASPAAPTPAPPQPPAPVPVPGATTPPAGDLGHHGHVHHETNALLIWSKKAWEGLKEGHFGNPKILLLILAVVVIGLAWWLLAHTSLVNDSLLWSGLDGAFRPAAATKDEVNLLTTWADDAANKDTVAARIARLNAIRLREADALRRLTGEKVADRQAAADELEKVRDELEKAAEQFPQDRTLRAAAYLDAADAELGLIGVPKKGVAAMGLEVRQHSRGKVEKYTGLLRKAAEAVGPTTEAGKGFIATADKYDKDVEASELYSRLGTFHASFNNPDPVGTGRPFDPTDPFGGDPGDFPLPNGPKRPTTIPDGPVKPDDKLAPGEGPKSPKPLDPPK